MAERGTEAAPATEPRDSRASATTTRISLLGPLRAVLGGSQVDHRLPGRRGRMLFALLVLRRDRALTRDEVIGALWPDHGPVSPGGALSTLLTRMRQVTGHDVVVGGRTIDLRLPEDAWIDVEQVARLVETAERALDRDDPGRALGDAELACELSSDGLLPELDEPWIAEHRQEVADLAAAALEVHARAALLLGGSNLLTARTVARRLIEREPYRESGYALLMEAHARAGEAAEALRVFERVRVLLRDELGTVPSKHLTQLHQRVLEDGLATPVAVPRESRPVQPTPPPAPAGLPPAAETLRRSPFVGRGDELAELERHWAGATGGEQRLVLVSGEPGIGKSALAAQLAGRVHATGGTVLWGRCDEHSVVPYQPVAEALGRHAAQVAVLAHDDPRLAAIGRFVPELRDLLPEERPPVPGEVDTDRHQLFEAVRLLLTRTAAAGPVLLVLEDLHWADRSTLLMLRHVVWQSGAIALLLLVTHREDENGPGAELELTLADLLRSHPGGRVTLGGLNAAESRELIEAATTGIAGPDVVRRWHERTEGHPFFLTQLALSGAASMSDPRSDEAELPAGVRELIDRRVGRLEPAVRAILRAAAVVGREFGVGLVAQLTAHSFDATFDALEQAAGRGLLVEVPERIDRFAFTHALVRDALREEQSRSRRVRLHARVAEALEASPAETSPSELAYHFYEGRHIAGHEPAVRYSARAAAAATEAFAFEEAAAHLGRALTALSERGGPDSGERCDLLIALGEAQWRSGEAAAETTFRHAAASARALGDVRRQAQAALGGRHLEAGVRDDARVALLDEALAALGDEDPVLRVKVLARLAAALQLADGDARALDVSAQAMELARELDDPEASVAALVGRHAALTHIDHVDERLTVLAELVELAAATGDPDLGAYGHQWSAHARFELGDLEGAAREFRAFAALARHLHQPTHDHFVLSAEAVFAQLDGRFDDAERLAFEGFTLAERVPGTNADRLVAAQISFIRREQGRLGEILPGVQAFVDTADSLSWRAGMALTLALGGDGEAARRVMQASADAGFGDIPRDHWWLTTVALFSEACAVIREPAWAARLYELLEPYADRHVQVVFTVHLGSVHRFLGLLSATTGDRGRARQHLETALARHERVAAKALVARSRADLAALPGP